MPAFLPFVFVVILSGALAHRFYSLTGNPGVLYADEHIPLLATHYFSGTNNSEIPVNLTRGLLFHYGAFLGIKSIILPRDIKILSNEEDRIITMHTFEGEHHHIKTERLKLPLRVYKHPEDLIAEINRTIQRYNTKFIYNNETQLVDVDLAGLEEIEISERVANILGLSEKYLATLRHSVTKGTLPVNLLTNTSIVFVTSDAVKGSSGDEVKGSPGILTILSSSSINEQEYSWREFDKIHYLPLLRQYIKEFKIYLRDPQGNPLSFDRGHAVVELDLIYPKPVDDWINSHAPAMVPIENTCSQ